MNHELKCWPQYYERIFTGEKKFELRKNDRDFQVGDWIQIREWDSATSNYTGNELTVRVTYLLHGPCFGLQEGWVIMGIEKSIT